MFRSRLYIQKISSFPQVQIPVVLPWRSFLCKCEVHRGRTGAGFRVLHSGRHTYTRSSPVPCTPRFPALLPFFGQKHSQFFPICSLVHLQCPRMLDVSTIAAKQWRPYHAPDWINSYASSFSKRFWLLFLVYVPSVLFHCESSTPSVYYDRKEGRM